MSTGMAIFGPGSGLAYRDIKATQASMHGRAEPCATVGMVGVASLVLGSRLVMPSWAVDTVNVHLLRYLQHVVHVKTEYHAIVLE